MTYLATRSFTRTLGALALVLACGRGVAADLDDAGAKQFFNAKGCNACHANNEMRIGPPYIAVAARYAAEPRDERIALLAAKIRAGGAGAWGTIPMISNPSVSQEDAERVVRWIFTLTPARESTPAK